MGRRVFIFVSLALGILWVASCQKPYISAPTGPAAANTATPSQTTSSTPTCTQTPTPSPTFCLPEVFSAATPAPTLSVSCVWENATVLAQGAFKYAYLPQSIPNPAIFQSDCGCNAYFDPGICATVDFETQTLIAAGYPGQCGCGDIEMDLFLWCGSLYLQWFNICSPEAVCTADGHYIVVPKTTLPLTTDYLVFW